MLDFDGLEELGNHERCCEEASEAILDGNCALLRLTLLPPEYFEAGLPPHLLSKREVQRTKCEERSSGGLTRHLGMAKMWVWGQCGMPKF